MVFPIIVQGEASLQYVFPTKQKAVQSAIDIARADRRIRRLILFGSAITLNCGIRSDIDLAIDAPGLNEQDFSTMAHTFYIQIDSEMDLVHYNSIHSQLLRSEIDQKGVCVYERCN